jgi:hypothetical protein
VAGGGIERIEMFQYERPPQRFIVIGTPSLGRIRMEWHYAMLALRTPLNTKVHHYSVGGRTVHDARNEIVARALALNASHVYFVDDDTAPPPDALMRLLARDRAIVSGLYYAKTSIPQPLVLHGRWAGTAKSWTPGEVVECYGHGMGCTLIRCEVFTDLATRGAVEGTGQPCPACGGKGCAGCLSTGTGLKWFYTTDETVVGPDQMPLRVYQTEDTYFLERAAEAGYQPSVDTGVFCWHFDLDTGKAYPVKQYEEYRSRGTVTWDTEAGPVTWNGVQPS